MTLWLVVVIGLLGMSAAYAAGHRRGSKPWREEKRQREIERRLMGREDSGTTATAEPAAIRRSRMLGTHAWKR
jgi:hypothetical protein